MGNKDETLAPLRGTPESAAWFREMLEALGETQASMARLMKRKGDDRNPDTIARHMRRMANAEARVSGEMRVILNMMLRAKKKAEQRAGATKAAAEAQLPADSISQMCTVGVIDGAGHSHSEGTR